MEYKKKFCAHRGISGLMPHNTLPSFAAAIALGADEIEFDVRETVDHKLIVSHEISMETIITNRMDVAALYRKQFMN